MAKPGAIDLQPGRDRVEAGEAGHALGVAQGEDRARQAAPVVRGDPGPLDAELVQRTIR